MTPAELRTRIDTFVILMMENRSFDHLLGYLSLPAFGGTGTGSLCGNECLDAIDHFTDAANVPGGLVGNIDIKFLLESEEDVYGIHGVHAKFVEPAVKGDLLFGEPLGFSDYVQDVFRHATGHSIWLTVSNR